MIRAPEKSPPVNSADRSSRRRRSDKTIRLWKADTSKEIRTLTVQQIVGCVAFAPAGKTLASAGDSNTVRLWDVGKGEDLHALKGE
jgi:WD40 repeat protein